MSAIHREIRHGMDASEKLGPEIHFLGKILGEVIREQAGVPLYDLEEEIRLGSRARGKAGPTPKPPSLSASDR